MSADQQGNYIIAALLVVAGVLIVLLRQWILELMRRMWDRMDPKDIRRVRDSFSSEALLYVGIAFAFFGLLIVLITWLRPM